MSGDHSRDSFDALRDYAGVFLQQGRAVLDSDWNEMVRVFERRIRAGTVDTIGRATVPRETAAGFRIRATAAGAVEIGRGRLYLDGMLVECHGAANYPGAGDTDFADPAFDRARQGAVGGPDPEGVLDEPIPPDQAADPLPYERQPYWPVPDALPATDGPHLAYLVAWQREVTPIETPELLEPALGGIDTTTRWQTVWQVRLLPDVGDGATCQTPDGKLKGWAATIAPSAARLTTGSVAMDTPETPCLVPPTDGYTGLENQFYRVQIHATGSAQTDASFKFSRENASVAAAIESFAGKDRITVRRIGRDAILRFRAGDRVEVTDDRREFAHRSGQILRVAAVHDETREIELDGTLDADLIPSGTGDDTALRRHSRLIRWDQGGVIRRADGTEWVDLDAPGADGLIPVPPAGTVLVLESGVTVAFDTAAGSGAYHELDAWSFAARTAGTQVETLAKAPPQSVQRHYCRLAIVTFPNAQQDCRTLWPPDPPGATTEGCACSVCVTAQGHNSGTLTLQSAIDQVGTAGGTVCLDAGTYILADPLRISGRLGLTLRGQGMGTLITYRGRGSAIELAGSVDVGIERLSLLVIPDAPATGAEAPPTHGITATHTAFAAFRRLAVVVAAAGDTRQDHGIALEGLAIGTTIEECLMLAPVALGAPSAFDRKAGKLGYVGLADFRATDNLFFGARAAVRLSGTALNLAGVAFSRNLSYGHELGLGLNWFEPPGGSATVTANTILSGGDGVRIGVPDLMLEDNEIGGGDEAGDGVRLVANVVPGVAPSAQVIGNRIGDLAGAGLRIEGGHDAVLIKRNMIRRCGSAGIETAPASAVRHLAIENNVVEAIAGTIDKKGAAAIALTRVLEGQVTGNAIRAVGLNAPDGSQTAGIALQGVGALAVADNTLYQIGPNRAEARATAILIRPPYFQVSASSNRIDGVVSVTDQGTGWMAIEIGKPGIGDEIAPDIGSVAPAKGHLMTLPGAETGTLAFAETGDTLYAVSTVDAVAVGPLRESQVSVQSNQNLPRRPAAAGAGRHRRHRRLGGGVQPQPVPRRGLGIASRAGADRGAADHGRVERDPAPEVRHAVDAPQHRQVRGRDADGQHHVGTDRPGAERPEATVRRPQPDQLGHRPGGADVPILRKAGAREDGRGAGPEAFRHRRAQPGRGPACRRTCAARGQPPACRSAGLQVGQGGDRARRPRPQADRPGGDAEGRHHRHARPRDAAAAAGCPAGRRQLRGRGRSRPQVPCAAVRPRLSGRACQGAARGPRHRRQGPGGAWQGGRGRRGAQGTVHRSAGGCAGPARPAAQARRRRRDHAGGVRAAPARGDAAGPSKGRPAGPEARSAARLAAGLADGSAARSAAGSGAGPADGPVAKSAAGSADGSAATGRTRAELPWTSFAPPPTASA